jgi:hypothetical protein
MEDQMIGQGSPKGTYSSRGVVGPYAHLVPGNRYRVVKAFKDFDRQEHAVGESWTYIGTAFLPYDDGRSIFVSLDGEHEWHIRMQDREEEQRGILDDLKSYAVEA